MHGLEGLFVVDASVIPTIPRANTNLSTVAVAEPSRSGSRRADGQPSAASTASAGDATCRAPSISGPPRLTTTRPSRSAKAISAIVP